MKTDQVKKHTFNEPRNVSVVCARFMRAIVGILIFTGFGCIWIALPKRLSLPLPRLAFCILLWGFGIRVSRHGVPPSTGQLCVANHVSWTDIPVLGVTLDAAFVAKQEVRRWPGIGRLAERYGCLFVTRDRRTSARSQAESLAERLRSRNIILFPEGTTGNGMELLPFRSSLIEAAAGETGCLVPLTLAHRWADGQPLGPEDWNLFAWVGHESLFSHAIKLARTPPIEAKVIIGAPIESDCRKELAQRTRLTISHCLETEAITRRN
jgi:lyso-ornithine lipid O-acyltransferase